MTHAIATAQIQTANLSPAVERNAMRLLAHTSADNGGAVFTRPALCVLFGVKSWPVAQRYLGAMVAANLLHYSTNSAVYIYFRAWPTYTESTILVDSVYQNGRQNLPNGYTESTDQSDEGTPNLPKRYTESTDQSDEGTPNLPKRYTESTDQSDEGTPNLPKRYTESTKKVHGIYQNGTFGGDYRGGKKERVLSSPLPDDEFFQSFVPEAEQKMSIAILTDPDIRVGVWKARLIAQRYPFATVRAYCTDFVAQGKRPHLDAGLVDYWLKNEPVPPVVVGELYRRHRTPAEIAAEVEEQRLAEEQRIRWEAEDAAKAAQSVSEPAPQPQPAPTPTEPQPQAVDVWAQVLARLAATLPAATFAQWVKATSLLGVEDGLYTVGTPDAKAREWLHNRLNQPVQRALSGVVGRSVTVQFVVKSTRGETADVREN